MPESSPLPSSPTFDLARFLGGLLLPSTGHGASFDKTALEEALYFTYKETNE